MKVRYEKHQRDYTVLASSEIIEEFFSARMEEIFFYKPHPIYMLVDGGIFYHFIAAKDYSGWPHAYVKKYSYVQLQKYAMELSKELVGYRKFLNARHKNIIDDILKLHAYMRLFTPLIIVSAYVPMYCENADKDIIDLCLKLRKKYEDVHKRGISLQKKLLNKLENKLALKQDLLQYLTSREFKHFLSSQVLPEDMEKRKDFVLIENFHRREKIFFENKALVKIGEIDVSKKQMDVRKIKGYAAFRGVARGKVKILRLVKDAQKIKKGDILVTAMTDPRYVPAMKRATAFVTDEGGITCHAAIVAREMKKPCIIGTKIATQVLKDGDLVEVDADNGVVRILERAIDREKIK